MTKPETANFCQNCGSLLSQKTTFFKRHKGCLIAIFLGFFFLSVAGFIALSLLGFVTSIGGELGTRKEVIISGQGEDKIAVINIDGLIVEKEPTRGLGTFTEEFTSARRVEKILNDIASDSKVKILVLRINSPGGSAVAAEEILRALLDFKKQTDLKIVAYFSDLAASGGYYVALAADQIVASPANISGSIGVMISYLNFSDLAEKYGIRNIVYKSGPYKDILSEFRQPTEEEKKIIQSLVDEAHDIFIKRVAEGRKMSEEKVRQLSDGRIFSARKAQEQGLIDSLGSFETAIETAQKIAGLSKARVIEYGQPSFLELFLGNTLGRFNLLLLPQLGSFFDFKPGLRILYLYTP